MSPANLIRVSRQLDSHRFTWFRENIFKWSGGTIFLIKRLIRMLIKGKRIFFIKSLCFQTLSAIAWKLEPIRTLCFQAKVRQLEKALNQSEFALFSGKSMVAWACIEPIRTLCFQTKVRHLEHVLNQSEHFVFRQKYGSLSRHWSNQNSLCFQAKVRQLEHALNQSEHFVFRQKYGSLSMHWTNQNTLF